MVTKVAFSTYAAGAVKLRPGEDIQDAIGFFGGYGP